MASNWLARVRRLIAYFLTGVFPFLTFFLGIVFLKDVNVSAALALFVALAMTWFSNKVSSNPWIKVFEGDELLCLNLSGGRIEAYTLKVDLPYAFGKIAGKLRKIFFDRAAVFYMMTPKTGALNEEKDMVNISFDKRQYNSIRHDFEGVPTFIYDEQLANFITKDFLNDKEQSLFLKNQAFSVHNQLVEVKNDLHFYASYVNQKLLKDKLFGIDMRLLAVIALILIVAVFFGPSIVDLINSTMGKASTSISGAATPLSVKTVG